MERFVGGIVQKSGEFGEVGFADGLPEVAAAQIGRHIHHERLEGDPRFVLQVAPDLEAAQIEIAPMVKGDRPAFFLKIGGELLQERAARTVVVAAQVDHQVFRRPFAQVLVERCLVTGGRFSCHLFLI